jgi:hypothetical protein
MIRFNMDITTIEKSLSVSLSTTKKDRKPCNPLVDHRQLSVIYYCMAGSQEETCLRYSPGPNGDCTHQDILNQPFICRST